MGHVDFDNVAKRKSSKTNFNFLSILFITHPCCCPKMTPTIYKCHRHPCSEWETISGIGKKLWPVSVIHLSAQTHPKCHSRPCQRLVKRPSHCVFVCVTFSTSPRCVLSYLRASLESGWRADVEAPRSSANSLLMHHLCPSAPCRPRPLGSISALKLCLVGRRETKLCCYSNWRETGAKWCSKCYVSSQPFNI